LYKYERRTEKNKSEKRKRKAVIYVIVFTFLLSIGFIGGEMIFKKSNTKVRAASTEQNNNSVPADTEKVTENKSGNAETRETKVPDTSAVATDNINPYKKDGQKTAYLTFDDGPSQEVTPKILDILDSNNVKATFFVIGYMVDRNKDLLLREWNDGQSIGNHSYSHSYKSLYSNQADFISDIDKCEAEIKSIIGSGYNNKLLRFPGGSFGSKLQPYRAEAVKDGYHYVDWNALNGDAESNNVSVDKLIQRLKETTNGKEHVVILMHDAASKETTVQALPQIIEYLKQQGYVFKTLH
jgi:peptidoglycan-N-acetylglucosamine deacetylase